MRTEEYVCFYFLWGQLILKSSKFSRIHSVITNKEKKRRCKFLHTEIRFSKQRPGLESLRHHWLALTFTSHFSLPQFCTCEHRIMAISSLSLEKESNDTIDVKVFCKWKIFVQLLTLKSPRCVIFKHIRWPTWNFTQF